MGNYSPLPSYTPAVFTSVDSGYCTFELDGRHSYICETKNGNIVSSTVSSNTTTVRIVEPGARSNTLKVFTGYTLVCARTDNVIALEINMVVVPWTFIFHGERMKIKLVNNSSCNVTITRPGKDSCVVQPKACMVELLEDVLTNKGAALGIKACYSVVGGVINKTTHYEVDDLVFDCVDSNNTVTVTVRDASGG
jgi:hypothetical protein